MRWIFFSLLLLNALVLLWSLTTASPTDGGVAAPLKPFAYGGVPTLQLLSEDAGGAVESRLEQQVKGRVDAGIAMPSNVGASRNSRMVPMKDGKPLCEMVGPFEGRDKALQFMERLGAIDIQSEVRELELPAGSRFQVYLPAAASHKAALRKLAELQAKKVDSYIIPKGELENGISLGMFSQEALAEQQVKDMRAIGLTPEVKIIERTYWEIWVMLAPGEGGKMSNLAWGRVMEGINQLERRQNFCLDVAS